MKTKLTLQTIVALLLVTGFLAGCNDSNMNSPTSSEMVLLNEQALARQVAALPTEELSPEERASLLFMREEEKMARDIYLMMYQRYGHRVFNNIRRSEDVHMRAMLTLLNRYSIPDPVGENGVGVFVNPQLQALYDQLLARGNTSLTEAFNVGVVIEETDIADLTSALTFVDNADIILVYNNLLRGSRNHLAAFTRQL